jgi:hypothetical protein
VLSSPNSTCEWSSSDTNITYMGSNLNDTVVAMCSGSYGIYEFVLTETNGNCTSTDTIFVNYQPLYPDSGNDTTICDTIYEMNADATYSGFWSNNDPRISISDNNDPNAIISYNPNTIVWPQSGSFTTLFIWTIDGGNGCQYSDSVRITFSQCLNNVNTFNKSKITRIYPNPAHNFLHIDINNSQYGDKVEILNIDGKLVKQITINNNSFNISDLDNGVYFVKVGNTVRKFVKE